MTRLSASIIALFTSQRRTRALESGGLRVAGLIGCLLASSSLLQAQTAPSLTHLSPNSGIRGTEVTILGANSGGAKGTSTVTFNGTAATPTSWSDTGLVTHVPDGATTGNLVVTVGGLASNAVPRPTLTILNPTSGAEGTSVTIAGTRFGATQGNSTITFNGTVSTPTSWSRTSLVAPVPVGATTGNVMVTVGGQNSNGVMFIVPQPPPTLTTLNPTSGVVGASVTVAGTNFGATQGTSTVAFNGTAATPTSWSTTSLVAPVPTGATTGNVVVTVGGLASNGVSFTVNPGLPVPWTAQDIGSPALAGQASYASGVFSVTGGGVDIWNVSDQFQFVYQTLSGDGEIVALVSSLQNVDPWAKAGVMIRQDLTSGSPHATAFVTSANGMTFADRVTAGGTTTSSSATVFAGAAPFWIRVVRSGNTFTGYCSATGTAWILMGSTTIPMATNAYVGLAVNSDNPAVVTVGTFSNVTVSLGASTPSLTTLNPTSGVVGTAVTIAGTNFGATQGTSTVTFNGTATTPTAWSATSIVAPVPAGATTGSVMLTVGGLASNAVLFTVSQPPPPPTLTSLNPASGAVGTSVTIMGANFGATQGTSAVTFNGMAATPTSWSTTSIVAPVPIGATTGNVVATVSGLTSNGMSFIVTASAPSLTSLSPTSGIVGTSVTIAGTNFGGTQGASTVAFNGKAATPTSWSTTSIVAPVPIGATTGNVVATVSGLTSNGVSFTVTASAPTLTSLSPTSGAVGTSVTIAGANFGATPGTSTVAFNGTAATPTSWSTTSLVAPVPVGATTGTVVVTVGGLASNGITFTVTASAPSLTSLSPTSGVVGTVVTIAGANFGATPGTSTVTFNGTAATPTSWSTTSLVAPVPAGATTGNVVVTVGGLASNGVSFTVNPGLPVPWTAQDIGSPALAGQASYASGVFSVTGGGVDIWNVSDQFQFVYQTLSGDGEIVALVSSLQNVDPWAKAGVMIRQDLTSGSPHATAFVTSANGMTFADRVTAGGTTTSSSATVFAGAAPFWIRVVRSGNTFTGYCSATGTAWILMGSTTIPMATNAYVGLAVNSDNPAVVTVGTFSNVTVSLGASTPSLTTLNPTSGVVGTAVTIAGTNFGATQGTSTVTFNGTATTPTAWSATSIVAPVPAGATTGSVMLTVGGLASNAVLFTVSQPPPPPSLTSLNPASGAMGTSVTIMGANFGATQGTSAVTFNGMAATPTSWSTTSIVAPVPIGATTGNVVATVSGLASNGMSFIVTASAPSLTSLSPTSGIVGTSVTIAGTNFGGTQGASTVKFNGMAATPTTWSATSLVAPVPAGATTGTVVVTVGGQASNGVTFTVTASAPSLTSLSPSSGAVGTSVTIAGANFGATQGASTVKFNGTAATLTSWSATSLVAPVPAGATTGTVVVTVGGQASNGVTFTVTASAPSLTSLSPSSGAVGTSITMAGANFGATQGASTVKFNGMAATPTAWSATSIVVPVPGGATTGMDVVTVSGMASNGINFTVTASAPSLTSLSPTSGVVGTAVTIAGANFGATQGTSTVTFNGIAATPTTWSATSIVVPVPGAATTGPVLATVGGLASNAIAFTVIQTAAVTATWNANTESNIAGYVLSYGTQTGVYSTSADVGNVTTWQGSLASGVGYYFAVKAYNTSQQFSPYSAEVFYTVAGGSSMLTLMAPVNQTKAQNAAVSLPRAASQVAPATLTSIDPTLAAFWQLNDGVGTTALDASGHGMNGTLVNGPAWTAGRLGGALGFDGLNNHVTTNLVQSLTSWTVAAWVQSPAAPASASGSGPVQRGKNFEINWNHPDAALRGAAALSVGGTWYAASFGPLAANTWYHLVGTYDGDTLRAYVNGVLATANHAPSGNPDLESLPLELGARAGASSYFAGVVSGVRIYSRAIGPMEVAALAQQDATPPTAVALSASSTDQVVSLSWTAAVGPNSGVSLYRIYRGTTVGGAKSPLAEGLATSLSYQDRGTAPFTTYYYEVSAVNGNGVEGTRSNEAVVVTTFEGRQP